MGGTDKIVYILTSDSDDSYLEQLAISLSTLRQHSDKSNVAVLCDKETYDGLTGARAAIRTLVDEFVVVEVPRKFHSKMLRSRWLKTTIRRHLNGNLMMLDTDTIIMGTLEDTWDEDIALGCVKDLHGRGAAYGWNSGVMFIADKPVAYEFFEKWSQEWQKGVEKGTYTDQQSFNKTSESMPGMVSEMTACWNYQISTCMLPPQDVKIVHYFTYDLDRNENEIRKMLDSVDLANLNPLSVSSITFQILALRQAKDKASPERLHLTNCGYLYHQAPHVFAIVDKMVGMIYRIFS